MTDPSSDWAMRIIRAYTVFGANPTDSEFGLWDRVKGVINNPEFEKKIKRGKHTGRFEEKPDAFIPEKEARADLDLFDEEGDALDVGQDLQSAEPSKAIPMALGEALFPILQSQKTVWTDNVPPPVDDPLLDEHFLDADTAIDTLMARGMSRVVAMDYVTRGTVITRDGKNFAWIPEPASEERIAMDERIMDLNTKIAEMEQARRRRISEIFDEMYNEADFEAHDDPEQFYQWLMEDATEEADGWFERSGFKEDLRSYQRQLAGWEKELAAIPPPETDPERLAQQREDVRQILNAAEWVDQNVPPKYKNVPVEVRDDFTVYEALTNDELMRVYRGRGAEEHKKALAFTRLGSNRITVLTDRFDPHVEKMNAVHEEGLASPEHLRALTWSQRASRNEDGTADRVRRFRYTIAHERGHTMDMPVEMFRGEPLLDPEDDKYAMSADRGFIQAALAAGGVSGYGSSDGKPHELVAELMAQYIMHDQFLPPDQRNPSVQVMVEWFDLELTRPQEPLSPAEEAAMAGPDEDWWKKVLG